MDKKAPRSPRLSGQGGPAPYAILLAAAATLAAAPARAADPPTPPTLLVSSTPDEPREGQAKKVVRLRPNVAGQRVYLWVNNPGEDDVKVSVALRGPAPRGTGHKEVLRSKPVTVKAGKTESVAFDGPAPPAAPAGQPPAPAGLELTGLPSAYELVLLDGEGKEVPKSARRVELMQPSDYVDVPTVVFDGNTRTLRVSVTAGKDFAGPEALVELVVSPKDIPGLIDDPDKDGTYERNLTAPGDKVELIARNLRFDERKQGTTANGLVSVTVDGYERAFLFRTTFRLDGGANRGDRISGPVVGLHWPRYQPPGPACHVRLDVDNAPPDSTVELALKHGEEGQAFAKDDLKLLRAPREQHVWVAPAEGGLAFETRVRDWGTDMDSRGLYKEHALRVRLLKQGGAPVEIFDARDLDEARPAATKSIDVPVTFDATPADIKSFGVQLTKQEKGQPVSFVATRDTPKADNQMLPGAPLRLVLKAADPESGIKKVVFFLGKPAADPKTPGTLNVPDMVPTVPGKPDDRDPTTWRAELQPPPTDPKGGAVTISAQVTNGAGQNSFGTIEIKLVPPPAPPPPGPPPKPSIEGTVVDTAGRGQPKLPVTLIDSQNIVRDTQTTDASGKFVFKNVPPGAYRVSSRKTANNTSGSTAVEVAEGEKKTGVEIKLSIR
jgi:hypothetical protein